MNQFYKSIFSLADSLLTCRGCLGFVCFCLFVFTCLFFIYFLGVVVVVVVLGESCSKSIH